MVNTTPKANHKAQPHFQAAFPVSKNPPTPSPKCSLKTKIAK
ncbi:hypothetical protein [Kingella oralis]